MTKINGAESARRRAFAEATLARYPALDQEEIGDLKTWFGKEATALDVGSIASDPSLAAQYRRFAEEHLYPLTLKDLWLAGSFAAVTAAVIGAIALLAG